MVVRTGETLTIGGTQYTVTGHQFDEAGAHLKYICKNSEDVTEEIPYSEEIVADPADARASRVDTVDTFRQFFAPKSNA